MIVEKDQGKSDADHVWGSKDSSSKKKSVVKKEEPNFETTGKLAEDTNKAFNGIVIKYSEPAEARKPKRHWRLYPFKGEKQLPVLHIHRQSGYLLGRDRKVADIPIDPSCSKQHAVLQYRLVSAKKDGRHIRCNQPYIIDLESANGTYVNNQRIDSKKYVELMEKDVIKFGFSSRKYVLLHEHSTDSGDNDSLAEDNSNEESNVA
ncbi:PREDICTED: LOW QUALITY PROTEIN: smad nuclear-interacting protein 1-like [Diuraphis noxia]|uniref:LOW QUALITY PROTEIN: smad nuclear-interacting protein 1-like n=1 Tax=Diuraphis noxia TaxID=143948 RepID=UPI0007639265|nr:PREDICTED: LOW QUALITY PROTEIN: smad nuclear-interacting protein 1-like [Diuraphis noxia]